MVKCSSLLLSLQRSWSKRNVVLLEHISIGPQCTALLWDNVSYDRPPPFPPNIHNELRLTSIQIRPRHTAYTLLYVEYLTLHTAYTLLCVEYLTLHTAYTLLYLENLTLHTEWHTAYALPYICQQRSCNIKTPKRFTQISPCWDGSVFHSSYNRFILKMYSCAAGSVVLLWEQNTL